MEPHLQMFFSVRLQVYVFAALFHRVLTQCGSRPTMATKWPLLNALDLSRIRGYQGIYSRRHQFLYASKHLQKKSGTMDDEYYARNLWPCRDRNCRAVLSPLDGVNDEPMTIAEMYAEDQRCCFICGTFRSKWDIFECVNLGLGMFGGHRKKTMEKARRLKNRNKVAWRRCQALHTRAPIEIIRWVAYREALKDKELLQCVAVSRGFKETLAVPEALAFATFQKSIAGTQLEVDMFNWWCDEEDELGACNYRGVDIPVDRLFRIIWGMYFHNRSGHA